MLVDVIQLRVNGERLPRERIRELATERGWLMLNPQRPGYYAGKKRAPLLAGLVRPGATQWVFPPLDEAQVTRISNGAMLIRGVQEIGTRDRDIRTYAQEWVARPVTDPASAPPDWVPPAAG